MATIEELYNGSEYKSLADTSKDKSPITSLAGAHPKDDKALATIRGAIPATKYSDTIER
jgi:hypothetical protein